MKPDRRYDEREAHEIFAIAARSDAATPSHAPGDGDYTLGELQEIGREAGISPDHVAEAARKLDAGGRSLPEQRSLGMRVSVGQVVPLPRRPTDAEWDALVTELRDIFAATGEVREQGGAREWSNGALRVLLEPTAEGHQLRLTTVNRRFRSLNRMGAVLGVWGLVFVAFIVPDVLAAGGTLADSLGRLLPSLIVGGAGAGAIVFSGLSLPKWVKERRSQFQGIADRAQRLLAAGSE